MRQPQRWSDPRIDLSPFEEMFGLSPIPVWVQELPEGKLAAFHPPECGCGEPNGISIDLDQVRRSRYDTNEVLLHEAMHALHYHHDPEGSRADKEREFMLGALTGRPDLAYHNSDSEQIANAGAEFLQKKGLRVWNP